MRDKYRVLIILIIYIMALILTLVTFIYKWQLGLITYMVFGMIHVVYIYSVFKDVPPEYFNPEDTLPEILDAVESDKKIAMIFCIEHCIKWPMMIESLVEGGVIDE